MKEMIHGMNDNKNWRSGGDQTALLSGLGVLTSLGLSAPGDQKNIISLKSIT
jgi:hypothetical protein